MIYYVTLILLFEIQFNHNLPNPPVCSTHQFVSNVGSFLVIVSMFVALENSRCLLEFLPELYHYHLIVNSIDRIGLTILYDRRHRNCALNFGSRINEEMSCNPATFPKTNDSMLNQLPHCCQIVINYW